MRSNVVGYVAIFLFAVGGTAMAANTVFSEDIVNGEVRSPDLANNGVQSIDVRDDSLTGSDVSEATLGEVPLADLVSPNGVRSAAIRADAVTPQKLGTVPAVNTINISSSTETTTTAQNAVLHGTFDIYDTANVHDEAAGAANLVAPVDGMYSVSATIDWDANSTGYRRSTITGPSGTVASVAGPPLPFPGVTSQNPSGIERLAAGQSVRVEVLQGSGGNLGARLTRFQMTMVGGY